MTTIQLTKNQNEFLRGALECCGWDEEGEGERLIALLENADIVTLTMSDTWEEHKQ